MSQKHSSEPASSAASQLTKAKDTAVKIGEDFKSAAMAKAEDVLHSAQTQIEAGAKDLWQEVQNSPMVKDANQYVRQEPLKALLISFGAGIIVGMAMRR